jgi:hypothetical protein
MQPVGGMFVPAFHQFSSILLQDWSVLAFRSNVAFVITYSVQLSSEALGAG